jgi:Flp pilus assembly pilin Flp
MPMIFMIKTHFIAMVRPTRRLSKEPDMKLLHTFVRDEDGAVTVDWVVLTAAVVVLVVGVGSLMQPAVDSELTQIASTITN